MNDGIVFGKPTDSRFLIVCRAVGVAFAVIIMVMGIGVLTLLECVWKKGNGK